MRTPQRLLAVVMLGLIVAAALLAQSSRTGSVVADTPAFPANSAGSITSPPLPADPASWLTTGAEVARHVSTTAIDSADGDLELIGQLGGLIYAVTVQGDYAYLGSGPRLLVLDVSTPGQPTVVGQSAVWNTKIMNMEVAGPYAYVTDWLGDLHILDISDPTRPGDLGFYATPEAAFSVALDGDYAYLANGYAGLRILDVSNPAAPTEVISYTLSDLAYDVEVKAGYAFVAGGTAGLRILDISNPATPTEVGSLTTLGTAYSVEVEIGDGLAYLVDGQALHVIDISNPAAPTSLGSYATTRGIALDVKVEGDHAYVIESASSRGNGGLCVVDVSDPANPRESGFLATPGFPQRLAATGGLAFVADFFGLSLIDTSNPTAPAEAGHYAPPTFTTGVAVAGDYAYVAEETGLRTVDIAQPAAPAVTGQYDMPGPTSSVLLSDTIAFVGDVFTGLRAVDISDPTAPTEIGFCPIPGVIYDMALAGNHVYIAAYDAGLRIVDISDPSAPTEVGSLPTPGYARDVAVKGNYAYVIESTRDTVAGELRIIDVSEPSLPAEVGYYDVPDGNGGDSIAILGDYAYITEGIAIAIRILDITNPTQPIDVHLIDTELPGFYPDLAAAGHHVYIVGNENRWVGDEIWDSSTLRILDVSDPAEPLLSPAYDIMPGIIPYSLAIDGNYIYYANSHYGLFVLWYGTPTTSEISTEGGTLESTVDQTSYVFPPGTFSDTIILTHTVRAPEGIPPTGSLVDINHAFEATAVYSLTGLPAQPIPDQAFTITVDYAWEDVGTAIENTLALYWWDGDNWVRETSSTVDTTAHRITANPNHLALWAVLGETHRLYLPMIQKVP